MEDRLSALHIAACKGQTGIAKLLINNKCNVNILTRFYSHSGVIIGVLLYRFIHIHIFVCMKWQLTKIATVTPNRVGEGKCPLEHVKK